MLLGAWAAVAGGVWIGGRAGALPAGSAALSLPPYVCAVTWWQRRALIWLALPAGMALAQHGQPGWKKGVGWMVLEG